MIEYSPLDRVRDGRELRVFNYEPSRQGRGVAKVAMWVEPALFDQYPDAVLAQAIKSFTELGDSPRALAYHGENPMPSTDPADHYMVFEDELTVSVHLRGAS